jgi:hypothetical protein
MSNIIGVGKRDSLFQLIFLREDDDEGVEVEETEYVDFSEVKRRLENGESVFIVRKHVEELGRLNARLAADQTVKQASRKKARKPLYFTHA